MDLDKLSALFDLLTEKDIAEFEHEDAEVRVRVSRVKSAPLQPVAYSAAVQASAAVPAIAAAKPDGASAADSDTVDVTSPFVGTFYRSASPDAPTFVEIGSVVRSGQTLCIIEAMKLMNEIEAEHAGTVVEIFGQNGKSVEYGQKLFRIKKA